MNGHSNRGPVTGLVCCLLASLPFCVYSQPAQAILAPPAPPLEYLNQNSTTWFLHSGIVTTTGTVWDTNFANFVNTGIRNKYNETAFAFMECYGGGMIDELGALDLVPASYTSASRWNARSYAWNGDPASGGKTESTYNLHFAPAAGGNAAMTMISAATAGQAGDVLGPLKPPVVVDGKTARRSWSTRNTHQAVEWETALHWTGTI
jgi:hypothetical protein